VVLIGIAPLMTHDYYTDGKKQQVVIHNIYHPVQDNNLRTSGRYQGIPKSSCLPQLETLLSRNSSHAQVVVGDFNLHHPKWSPEDIREYSRPATTNMLLEIMSRDLPYMLLDILTWVNDYNHNMNSVDLANQHRQSYDT
jgi:hypothetical protein